MLFNKALFSVWSLILLFAVTQQATAKDDYDRLLDLSAVTQQIQQIPSVFQAAIQESYSQNPVLPYSSVEKLIKSTQEAFVAKEIQSIVKTEIGQKVSKQDIKELFKWYESDLAKKISREEAAGSTPQAYEEISINGHTLLNDKEKVAFAQRVDRLIEATEFNMALQEYTALATLSSLMAATRPNQQMDMPGLKAMIKTQIQQARPQVEQQLILNNVYSYRNLDMKELAKYEAFLSTPSAKTFHKAMMEGMKKAMESAITKWASILPTAIQSGQQ